MNVSMEVYAEILPEACLWCCADWLYNEPEVPAYLADGERLFKQGRIRMYGTALTRKWMDLLGVKDTYAADTVGGWVAEVLGIIPYTGAKFETPEVLGTVTQMEKRRVTRVRVWKKEAPSADEAAAE